MTTVPLPNFLPTDALDPVASLDYVTVFSQLLIDASTANRCVNIVWNQQSDKE